MAAGNNVKTPDLTLVVRVHDLLSFVAVLLDDGDGTVALSNDKAAVVVINSTDEVAEGESTGNRQRGGVNLADVSVLASREKLTFNPADGANKTAGVCVNGGLNFSVFPNVDLGVASSSVSSAIGVVGAASEGSHGVSAKETSLFLTRLSIPEVDVLGASSAKSGRSGLGREANVVNFVGVALLLLDLRASSGIKHMEVVLVAKINTGSE